jgi:hypothetical protein
VQFKKLTKNRTLRDNSATRSRHAFGPKYLLLGKDRDGTILPGTDIEHLSTMNE